MSEPDHLADALRVEGLDAAAIDRVRTYLRSNDVTVSVDWDRRWKRDAKAATAAAAAAALAMPDYHGAITQCQAQRTIDGRVTDFNRCSKKPVKVRRIQERSTIKAQPPGDGRLAVCMTHARAKYEPSRWYKGDHWTDRGKPESATEVVEPEYQPKGD